MKRLAVCVLFIALCALAGAHPIHAQTIPDLRDGLVSYWKLDEESGVRYDSHGGNDLTDNNTVGYTDGVMGNAAAFDSASNEYLSISDNITLSMSISQSFSIAGWFRLNTISDQTIIDKAPGVSGENREYRVHVNTSGNLRFVMGNGVSSQGIANTTVLTTGELYFFAAIHSAENNEILLYINSSSNNTGYAGGSQDTDAQITLGRNSPNAASYLDGALDEIAIWKRSLSESEIAMLYNDGYGLPYGAFGFTSYSVADITTNLAAFWEFEETDGTRYDSHGNFDLSESGDVYDAPGFIGTGIYPLDGNYLYHADHQTFSPGLGSWSIAAWVKPSYLTGVQPLLFKQDEYGLYLIDNTHVQLHVNNDPNQGNLAVTKDLQPNNWYFVVGGYDAVNSELFLSVDGVTAQRKLYTYGVADASTQLLIGYNGSTSLAGYLDHVGFWRRALTDSEIAYLYQSGQGRAYPFVTPQYTNALYLPAICMGSDCTGDYIPPSEDDDDDDIVILGPPQDDDTWREWADAIDAMLEPLSDAISDLLATIQDWNAQGCAIEGDFTPDGSGVEFSDDQTFQERAYNIGIMLGEPVGLLRGFRNAQIAPLTYIDLTINYLLAAIAFIVFVHVFTSSLWLIRWLYYKVYEVFKAIRG